MPRGRRRRRSVVFGGLVAAPHAARLSSFTLCLVSALRSTSSASVRNQRLTHASARTPSTSPHARVVDTGIACVATPTPQSKIGTVNHIDEPSFLVAFSAYVPIRDEK